MGGRNWGRLLDELDGKARPEDRPRSLIETHEGKLRSVPYRCRHRVVRPDGSRCLICDTSMDEQWRAAWLATSYTASSRPLPEAFGMEPVRMETDNGEWGPEGESAG